MSEEKELTEQEAKLFAKGFNAAYIIEKENPQLLSKLIAGAENKENLYIQGMVAGGLERKQEKYLVEAQEMESKPQKQTAEQKAMEAMKSKSQQQKENKRTIKKGHRR